MATIPIRDVPGEAVQPSGNELILIDNGIAMQKATINDAVAPKATEIADDKIADLNLGTASQSNVEDFATAAQGLLADSAVQPGDLATVATSGDYEDLQNKPTLGTAAAANIGETASDVAAGNRGLPSGGGTGEVLVKNSGSDYDAEWREVASTTAVSYAPQTLTPAEQGQARTNIGVGHTFSTVAALLADETMSYTPGAGLIEVGPGDIIEAEGFRYEVAASSASDHHVETASGVKLDAVATTVYDPRQFGIIAESDDVAYTTQQWQKLLDFAVGSWIDGGGRLYEIDRIFGHSHQRIRNVRFKKTASDQDINAALTFESEPWESGPTPPEPLRDIVLEDIEVDGNRDQQTNIVTGSEDGGRHCIAFYGRVHDVTLRRVYAHHAATDGVCFYSKFGRNPVYADRVDTDFCFRNVLFENCNFSWNGRGGYTIDSVSDFTSINGKYNDNGRDTKDTDPWDLSGGNQSSYGSRARTTQSGGLRFGRGLFWEEYGLGSSYANMLSIGDQCHRNAQGFLIHSGLKDDDFSSPGYTPRGPFKIVDIDIDVPLAVAEHGGNPGFFPAISVYASKGGPDDRPFQNIRMSGRAEGHILLTGVEDFHFDGDIEYPGTAKILTSRVKFASFRSNVSGKGVIYDQEGEYWYLPTISPNDNSTISTGAASPALIDMSGPYVLKYDVLVTPINNGTVSLLFQPPTDCDVDVLAVSAGVSSSGAPMAASISSSQRVTVHGASAGQDILFVVTVAVRPN